MEQSDEIVYCVTASGCQLIGNFGFCDTAFSKVQILPSARIGDKAPLGMVVYKETSPAIAIVIPKPRFRILFQRRGRNQEAKGKVGMLRSHWVVSAPQNGLGGGGVDTVGPDDNVSTDHLSAAEGYGWLGRVLFLPSQPLLVIHSPPRPARLTKLVTRELRCMAAGTPGPSRRVAIHFNELCKSTRCA